MDLYGVVDGRREQYTDLHRLHLIKCLGKWGASLYIWTKLTWKSAYAPISSDDLSVFEGIVEQCKESGLEMWVGMKPGDFRFCMHRSDRLNFIRNASNFLRRGAKGLYAAMDDTHPDLDVRPKYTAP